MRKLPVSDTACKEAKAIKFWVLFTEYLAQHPTTTPPGTTLSSLCFHVSIAQIQYLPRTVG